MITRTRLLLACAIALLPALSFAQTVNWTIPNPKIAGGTACPGCTVTIAATFTASGATTASTDIEVHDQGNNKLLPQDWTAGVAFTAANAFTSSQTFNFAIPAAAVAGQVYSILVGAFNATTSAPVSINQNATFTIVAGTPSSAPPPVTTPPPPITSSPPPSMPICGPTSLRHMNIGAVPPGVETGSAASPVNDTWIAYSCTAGATAGGPVTGYLSYALLFNAVQVAPYIVEYKLGSLTMPQLAAQLMTFATALTPAEKTFTTSLLATNRPLAQVAPDGASATQPVYTNSGGSLSALPNESVAAGLRADETTISGPYCSVAGLPDQNGVALPAGSFAACTINLPNGTN